MTPADPESGRAVRWCATGALYRNGASGYSDYWSRKLLDLPAVLFYRKQNIARVNDSPASDSHARVLNCYRWAVWLVESLLAKEKEAV